MRYLHRVGELAVAHRRPTFETVYDLPERVLPAEVLAEKFGFTVAAVLERWRQR